MGRSLNVPSYDLGKVKKLVRRGSFSTTKRVRIWLDNHGYNPREIIAGVVEILSPEDFCKSDELEKLPGTMGDIYKVSYCDEDWYLKFFIDEATGNLRVRVWSCCWDGALH